MTRDEKRGLILGIMIILMIPVMVGLFLYSIKMEWYLVSISGGITLIYAFFSFVFGPGAYYLEKYRELKKQREEQKIK